MGGDDRRTQLSDRGADRHGDGEEAGFVGDTVSAIVEVTDARKASSGERGVVTTRVSVRNQDEDEVVVYGPVRLIRGRGDSE